MSNNFEYDRRERVSVYVDVLEAVAEMIEEGCFDQAYDTLRYIVNVDNREKVKTEKRMLYYAMKHSKNEAELKANRSAYIEYMRKSII